MKIALRIDDKNHILWLWVILVAVCLSAIGIFLPGNSHVMSLIFLGMALIGVLFLIVRGCHFDMGPGKELINFEIASLDPDQRSGLAGSKSVRRRIGRIVDRLRGLVRPLIHGKRSWNGKLRCPLHIFLVGFHKAPGLGSSIF